MIYGDDLEFGIQELTLGQRKRAIYGEITCWGGL